MPSLRNLVSKTSWVPHGCHVHTCCNVNVKLIAPIRSRVACPVEISTSFWSEGGCPASPSACGFALRVTPSQDAVTLFARASLDRIVACQGVVLDPPLAFMGMPGFAFSYAVAGFNLVLRSRTKPGGSPGARTRRETAIVTSAAGRMGGGGVWSLAGSAVTPRPQGASNPGPPD